MDVPGVFAKRMPRRNSEDSFSGIIQDAVDEILHQQYEEVIRSLQALSCFVSDTPFLSLDTLRNNCSYILMSLQTAMKNDHILNEWVGDRYSELMSELKNCFSQRELTHWLEQLILILGEMKQTRAPAAAMSERAAEYIRLHFAEDLSLGDIAGHCGISATYLSRIFAQEKGKGVQEYLTDVRMRRAKELLADTKEKRYEIAEEDGCSSAV